MERFATGPEKRSTSASTCAGDSSLIRRASRIRLCAGTAPSSSARHQRNGPSLGRLCPPTPTVGTSSPPQGATSAPLAAARRAFTRRRTTKKSMSCASQYRHTSAAYASRTSRDAFSRVFTTSAVVAFVHCSDPRVTMRA